MASGVETPQPQDPGGTKATCDFIERLMKEVESFSSSVSRGSFSRVSQAIFVLWTFLYKDEKVSSVPKQYLDHQLRRLIRLHQCHVVDDKWTSTAEISDQMKLQLQAAARSAENLVSNEGDHAEFVHLIQMHSEGWGAQLIRPILSGMPNSSSSSDYFKAESPGVTLKRLEVLVSNRLDRMALNLTRFITDQLNNPEQRASNPALQKWCEEFDQLNGDDGRQLLNDLCLSLTFLSEQESVEGLREWDRTTSVLEKVEIARRFRERGEKITSDAAQLSVEEKLLNLERCQAMSASLAELAMVRMVEEKRRGPTVSAVVWEWLAGYPDCKDPALETEVERYIALEGSTALIYEIGVQLHRKFGWGSRNFAVELTVRALGTDINRKEEALCRTDDESAADAEVKEAEESVADGMLVLAELLQDHLPVVRECLLTSFSLKPSEEKLARLAELAKASGLYRETAEAMDDDDGDLVTLEEFNRTVLMGDFDKCCIEFLDDLAQGKYSRAYCGKFVEKRTRNLDALLSIQGDLITEAANYDPVSMPMPSFTAAKLGLDKDLVSDLLVVISSPRWHFLTWVLEWPELESRCRKLLNNPDCRNPIRELKHLVIDYSQFDEWSSDDDDVEPNAVIERGYEDWADEAVVGGSRRGSVASGAKGSSSKASRTDEDVVVGPIIEKGLEADEAFDFNVVPKLYDEAVNEAEEAAAAEAVVVAGQVVNSVAEVSSNDETVAEEQGTGSRVDDDGLGAADEDVNMAEVVNESGDVPNDDDGMVFNAEEPKPGHFLDMREETMTKTATNGSRVQPVATSCDDDGGLLPDQEMRDDDINSAGGNVSSGGQDLVCNWMTISPSASGVAAASKGIPPCLSGRNEQIQFLRSVVPGLDGDTSFARLCPSNQKNPIVFAVHVTSGSGNSVTTAPSSNRSQEQLSSVPSVAAAPPQTASSSGTSSAPSTSTATPAALAKTTTASRKRANLVAQGQTQVHQVQIQAHQVQAVAADNAGKVVLRSSLTPSSVDGGVGTESAPCVVGPTGAATPILRGHPAAAVVAVNHHLQQQQQHVGNVQILGATSDSVASSNGALMERKVQYVYKQGGQTLVIDYPVTADVSGKFKTFQFQQQQPQQQQIRLPMLLTTTTAAAPSVVVPPKYGSLPASAVAAAQPQALLLPANPVSRILLSSASSSVDSLANSLISQIQTPIITSATPVVSQIIVSPSSSAAAAAAPSAGQLLPKFQFAFGSGQRVVGAQQAGATTATLSSPTSSSTALLPNPSPEIVAKLIKTDQHHHHHHQGASQQQAQQQVQPQQLLVDHHHHHHQLHHQREHQQQVIVKQVPLAVAAAVNGGSFVGSSGRFIHLPAKAASIGVTPSGQQILLATTTSATQSGQNHHYQQQQRCVIQALPGVAPTPPRATVVTSATAAPAMSKQINALIQQKLMNATPVTTAVQQQQQQLIEAAKPKNAGGFLDRPVSQSPAGGAAAISGGVAATIVSNNINNNNNNDTINKGGGYDQDGGNQAASGSQVDLIRQLNLARAQGSVVLQQWGDKQVLVHKATGRWIMRQGNRLVTVPPQALGIAPPIGRSAQPNQADQGNLSQVPMMMHQAAAGDSSACSNPTMIAQYHQTVQQGHNMFANKAGAAPLASDHPVVGKTMSSSTMEQLAEFDSILESKFNSCGGSNNQQQHHLQQLSGGGGFNDGLTTTSLQEEDRIVSQVKHEVGDGHHHLQQQHSVGSTSSPSSSSCSTTEGRSPCPSHSSSSSGRSLLASPGHIQSPPTFKLHNYSSDGSQQQVPKSSTSSAPSSPVKHSNNNSSNGSETLGSTPQFSVSVVARSASSASPSPCPSMASWTTSSSVPANAAAMKPPPKPQEDPDTLKRIQQILDDYNEQIRKSPDLQKRPAPRRRASIGQVAAAATSSSPAPPPSAVTNSPGLAPSSPCLVTPAVTKSSKKIGGGSGGRSEELKVPLKELKPEGVQALEELQGGGKQQVVRHIVMPSSLAASLQASGRQLVVVTGPGGRKMIALKPMMGASATSSSSSGGGGGTSSAASAVSPGSPASSLSSLSRSDPPGGSSGEEPMIKTPLLLGSSPSYDDDDEDDGPDNVLDRAATPGLGIPMEMIPGQIMEAEISAAATLLNDQDDNDSGISPLMTSTTSTNQSSRRHHHVCPGEEDEENQDLFSSLTEDLFSNSEFSTSPLAPTSPQQELASIRPPTVLEDGDDDDDDEDDEDEQLGKASPEGTLDLAAAEDDAAGAAPGGAGGGGDRHLGGPAAGSRLRKRGLVEGSSDEDFTFRDLFVGSGSGRRSPSAGAINKRVKVVKNTGGQQRRISATPHDQPEGPLFNDDGDVQEGGIGVDGGGGATLNGGGDDDDDDDHCCVSSSGRI